MAWELKWTEPAWHDLENVVATLSEVSPNYARALLNEVMEVSRLLETFANQGRIVPELMIPQIRELFIRNYRLIYQVTGQIVFILGFVHSARDLNRFRNLRR